MPRTNPLMAGEHHLETGEGAQTEKEKDCDGVNVDSRSANSARFGRRLSKATCILSSY